MLFLSVLSVLLLLMEEFSKFVVICCFYIMKVKVLVTQSCPTLCDLMDYSPPGSSVREDSPGKNTGVDHHASSRGFSQPKDRTQVSCIAGGFWYTSNK